jgi:polyisoprenyl-phosphate glycosyltransferase
MLTAESNVGRDQNPGTSLEEKIRRLQGPILVFGGSGFIGANLARTLLRFRQDVFATATRLPAWRLQGLPVRNVKAVDLLIDSNLDQLLEAVQPQTVFDCVAYGGYSFETDSQLIYQTNFNLVSRVVARLESRGIAVYLHSGSSSEYGDNASCPDEDSVSKPNSHYSVSKIASANLLYYLGKKKGFPCANLRLYSIYGPFEDSSRLIPSLIRFGLEGKYPELVDPNISRDFLYVDDAVEAYIDLALNLKAKDYGASFNVGTGQKTTIGECAELSRKVFSIQETPKFSMPSRAWDVTDWYANITAIRRDIGWQPTTTFEAGLQKTAEWFRGLSDKEEYYQSSKRFGLDTTYSVSAIIACYKDARAIPIMYDRLKQTFARLNIDHEIIIRSISRSDRRVQGISHSRNFGSQAAFRSGMGIATKNSCVLLDGDLQDPPELIETMVAKWREGYDVAYGRRVKREATLFMQLAYKAFYRVFDYFSYVKIPHDAGDFSLMDRRVVEAILSFPERDFFLRGVRAFAGFKQVGVDYIRPERMFGVTTNSLLKNIGWAKKGIFSFSYVPLNILSAAGLVLFGITSVLVLVQLISRLLLPSLAPRGFTTVLIFILFFGSLNLLALSVMGEYLAKVVEEVKQRPHFIRRAVIREGAVRLTAIDHRDSIPGSDV